MNETFVHEQPVRFAHCDPAGIVYFPRFFDMAHSVKEDWITQALGVPMAVMIRERRVGTPTVHIDCDFAKPLRHGDTLRFELRVARMGRSSLDLDYTGLKDGELHLRILQTIVFMDLDTVTAVPIPEDLRPQVERYLVST